MIFTTNTQTLRALDALESSDYAKASREVQEAFLHGFQGNWLFYGATDCAAAWECGIASGMKPEQAKRAEPLA